MTDCFCEQNFGRGCKHAPLTGPEKLTVKKKNRGNWNKGYRQHYIFHFSTFTEILSQEKMAVEFLKSSERSLTLPKWTVTIQNSYRRRLWSSDFDRNSWEYSRYLLSAKQQIISKWGDVCISMTRFGYISPEISTTMRAELCSDSSKIWKSSAYGC